MNGWKLMEADECEGQNSLRWNEAECQLQPGKCSWFVAERGCAAF